MPSNHAPTPQTSIGFLLFPGITQLDLTGAFEVLMRLPDAKAHLLSKSNAPIMDRGLVLTPTADFSMRDALDIFVVPGGPGVDDVMLDEQTVEFVRWHAEHARYVFGICTGTMLLAATGLLSGKTAGGHWQARDLLARLGVTVSDDRTVIDGKYFTSGGVTAGIDLALRAVGLMESETFARQVQLQIEYAPEPPFHSGTPFEADPEIVQSLLSKFRQRRAQREARIEEVRQRLIDQAISVGS